MRLAGLYKSPPQRYLTDTISHCFLNERRRFSALVKFLFPKQKIEVVSCFHVILAFEPQVIILIYRNAS